MLSQGLLGCMQGSVAPPRLTGVAARRGMSAVCSVIIHSKRAAALCMCKSEHEPSESGQHLLPLPKCCNHALRRVSQLIRALSVRQTSSASC